MTACALRENEARLKLAETNLSVLKLQHEEVLNTQKNKEKHDAEIEHYKLETEQRLQKTLEGYEEQHAKEIAQMKYLHERRHDEHVKEAMRINAERDKDSRRHDEEIKDYKERYARTKEEHLKMRALLEKDVVRHEETIAKQTARHATELDTQRKEYEAQLLARSVDSQEKKYLDTLQETEKRLANVVQDHEGKYDNILAAYEARTSDKKEQRKEEHIHSHVEATSKVGAKHDTNLVQIVDVEGEETRRPHKIPEGSADDNSSSDANNLDAETFVRQSTSGFVGEMITYTMPSLHIFDNRDRRFLLKGLEV